jgi:hypothetical protein
LAISRTSEALPSGITGDCNNTSTISFKIFLGYLSFDLL